MFSLTLALGKHANANRICNNICHKQIRRVCTDVCRPFFGTHNSYLSLELSASCRGSPQQQNSRGLEPSGYSLSPPCVPQ